MGRQHPKADPLGPCDPSPPSRTSTPHDCFDHRSASSDNTADIVSSISYVTIDVMMTVRRVRRDDDAAVRGTGLFAEGCSCSFDAPDSSNFANSTSGRTFVLADFLDRGIVASRKKMDVPSSSSDASTLTRTDSESTASRGSSALRLSPTSSSICDGESLTFGDGSHSLSVAEESMLQARFAERTAMEMAQIVAYWKERAAVADDDVSEGQTLPSPEECFPANSLLNTSTEDDERGSDGDCEIKCDFIGNDDGVQVECAGRWIGEASVPSTFSEDASLQGPLSRYAPIPPGTLRRRRNRADASQMVDLDDDNDEVRERHPLTPRTKPSPLVLCQRLAMHVAAVLWISAVIVRFDKNGRLAQFVMRSLLQMLVVVVRTCLWLLQAALKATS